MYPKSFRYHRPATVQQAISLLASLGDGAKPLAGGQSLIPMLKMRMDEPTDLVDIGRLYELTHIASSDGVITIGALATHASVAQHEVSSLIPALRDCAGGIADHQVRSLGTLGGSVSVADPSSDWPAVLHALEAEIVCQGSGGTRTLPINEFITDSYTTALKSDELVTQVRIKIPPANSGSAYIGFKKAPPAYPAASVGIQLTLGEGDECKDVRVALGSAGPTPVMSGAAEALLRGNVLDQALLKRAADAIVEAADPPSDSRGSAAFKCEVLRSLFMRAAATAMKRCRGEQIQGSHDYV